MCICRWFGGCHAPPRIYPSLTEIAHYVTSRLPRDTQLFANLLLSITKAMSDVQKKLQELSDSYQGFQAGEEPNFLCKILLTVG
jgi:hypothetical protein